MPIYHFKSNVFTTTIIKKHPMKMSRFNEKHKNFITFSCNNDKSVSVNLKGHHTYFDVFFTLYLYVFDIKTWNRENKRR